MKCYKTYGVSEPVEAPAADYFRVGFIVGALIGTIVTLSLVSAVALILFH